MGRKIAHFGGIRGQNLRTYIFPVENVSSLSENITAPPTC